MWSNANAFLKITQMNSVMDLCHRYQPDGLCTDLRKFIEGPSHYLTLPPELKSAVDAICYIAEQLQAEKDYEAVRNSCICMYEVWAL